ncbi:uncharacterized protein LOC143253229 isoform X2 [Tachypleus tridentatus]
MECERQQDDPYFEVSNFLENAWRSVSEASEELRHYMSYIIKSSSDDLYYYSEDSMLRGKNVCVSELMTHPMSYDKEDEGTICWNKGITTVTKIPRITCMIRKPKLNDESPYVVGNNVFDETHESEQQFKYSTSKESVKLLNNTFRSIPVDTTDQLLSWVDNLVKEVNNLNVDEKENLKMKNPSALFFNLTKKNNFTSKSRINTEDEINERGGLKLKTIVNNSCPRSSKCAKGSKCLFTQYQYSTSNDFCSDQFILKSTIGSDKLYTFDELHTNDKEVSKYNQGRAKEIQSKFQANTPTAITNALETSYFQILAPHTIRKELLGPMTAANYPKTSQEYPSPCNGDAARGSEPKCVKGLFNEVNQQKKETDKLNSFSSKESRSKKSEFCKQLSYTQSDNDMPEYMPEIRKCSLQTTYPICYSQDTKSFMNEQTILSKINEQCMKGSQQKNSVHMNAVKCRHTNEKLDVDNKKFVLPEKFDNVDKTEVCFFHENSSVYWDDSFNPSRYYKSRIWTSENYLNEQSVKNNNGEKKAFMPQNQTVVDSFSYENVSELEQIINQAPENSIKNQTLNESVDETELSFLTDTLNLLKKESDEREMSLSPLKSQRKNHNFNCFASSKHCESVEMGCTSCRQKHRQSVNDSYALSTNQVHKTSNELTLPEIPASCNNGFKSEISQTGLNASFRNNTLFENPFCEEINKCSESKIATNFATFPRTQKTTSINSDIIHTSVIHSGQDELPKSLFPDETLKQQINSTTFPRTSKSKHMSHHEIIKFMKMIASSTYKPPPEGQLLELKPDHSVENHLIRQSNETETTWKDSATQTDSWPSKCTILNSVSWSKELDCVGDDTEKNLNGDKMELSFLRSSFEDTVMSSSPSLASINYDGNLRHEQIDFCAQIKSCQSSKGSSLGLSECSSVLSLDENCYDLRQQHPSFENDNRELLASESHSIQTTQENCEKQLQIDSDKKLLQWKCNITKRPESQTWPRLSLNRLERVNMERYYSESSVVIKNFYNVQVEGKIDVMSIFSKQLLQKMNFKSLSDSMLQKDTIKNHGTLICYSQFARNTLAGEAFDIIHPSSQTKKECPEIEAQESCCWLRAAGFPQYAQLYEENQFPLDIRSVWKDHEFLDSDSFRALFRRLNTLNKCAKMKVDYLPRKSDKKAESDEEEQYALSENWKFQRTNQRWSRVPSPVRGKAASPKKSLNACNKKETRTIEEAFNGNYYDSVFVEDQHSSSDSIRQELVNKTYIPTSMDEDGQSSRSESTDLSRYSPEITIKRSQKTSENIGISLRRSGSEKLKNSGKTLLRRVESLTDRRKKKYSNESLVISAPWGFINMRRNWFPRSSVPDESPVSSSTSSPRLLHRRSKDSVTSDRISNAEYCSDRDHYKTLVPSHNSKWYLLLETDTNVFDSMDSAGERMRDMWRNTTSSISRNIGQFSNPAVDLLVKNVNIGSQDHNDEEKKSNSSLRCYLQGNQIVKCENCCKSQPFKDGSGEERTSVYDNLPEHPRVPNTNNIDRSDCCHTWGSKGFKIKEPDLIADLSKKTKMEELKFKERRDSGVGSSLRRTSMLYSNKTDTESHFLTLLSTNSSSVSVDINSLSSIQLMKLRKLSLLKLTTFMEKHSPSSKTGWIWRVPNFIRRIRSPDYKDKAVFGVPFLLNLQRTGQALPPCIQACLSYLRKTSLDSVGVFRKSGVRSRIQKLRNLNESNPHNNTYDDQQAYDVADMLKQYFRDLPEALFTNKWSETFISIFLYIPHMDRLDALHAAILLMPDENREVLQTLIAFLQEVSKNADENQMTATNLAACLAPSLFHLTTTVNNKRVSSRRSKTVGVPDQRELNEIRAAHECLTFMIMNYKHLFSVSENILKRLVLPQWSPSTLEKLHCFTDNGYHNWKSIVDDCIQEFQRNSKDKAKWIAVQNTENVEISFKKVDDPHPLRLWRIIVDVEAPPVEVLNRILRERNVWDNRLLKSRVVCRLDKQSEVFHYVRSSLWPLPKRDYCVFRSWKTDLRRGSCLLVEQSVDHFDAAPVLDGVRVTVLTSNYHIEPCGAGKSRVSHYSRIDSRGRSLEWYNKTFGHICAVDLVHLRDSFKHGSEGPETKV